MAAYFERLTAAFTNALHNAQQAGDLSGGADIDELASYLMMSLIGVAACVRAEAPSRQVRAACDVAVRALDAYR